MSSYQSATLVLLIISYISPILPSSPSSDDDLETNNSSFSAPNSLCPNTTDEDDSTQSPYERSSYLYLVFELLVALVTIIGNSLTIWVFVQNRKLRRLTNYYIVSLAAADLLVGVVGIPFAILTSIGKPEAPLPCLAMLCILILLCTISIFSLVGVSVDRYWAIIHPLIYARLMTSSRARREYFIAIQVSYMY